MTIRVRRLRNGAGKIFYAAIDPSADGFYAQFPDSAVDGSNKFEVVGESAVAEAIIRESDQSTLGPGWVRVPYKRRSESPAALAEIARGNHRRVSPSQSERGNNSVNNMSERERKAALRKRVKAAYKILGLTEEESALASPEDAGVLFEAWTIITGSVEGGRIARAVGKDRK